MGSSKKPSTPFDQRDETLLAYVERIREQAQAFQREIERKRQITREQLEDVRVRQAKKRTQRH